VNRDLTPTEGARYLLERTSEADGKATYRVAIYTPDATYEATATLGEDGTVAVAPTGAPAELDARLTTMAKLVARDAAKLRADGLAPWPSRILRWRK
jgi:hypothetical protein